jgi:TonB-dependent starch-binding outer membrane protein SusC
MRNLYLINKVLVLLLLLGSLQGYAQTRVTGKVTGSDDGTGLPGVSILEKGTTNGAVSDAEGNYSVAVSPNATLVFSFVGYATQEIAVNGRTTVDVILQTDVTALSEVVVIGYGSQEKKDVTGSVISLSNKEFNRGVVTSPQELLVGKVAGVSITPGSGAPGSAAQIRIRGEASLNASNNPLIVVDGFPLDESGVSGASNALASINPNDIETINVLKDASATAIYGSRASNGVIIITTKKGKEDKFVLNYTGNYSISKPAKYHDVLSADEYRTMVGQQVENGVVPDEALDLLGPADTDWQKEVFRNAFTHDHNLSASGKVSGLPYRVSYGFTDQEGILKNTDLQRNSLNLNFNPSLLDGALTINAGFKGSITNHNFGNEGAVGSALSFDPTQPVRSSDAAFDPYGGYFAWLGNGGAPITIATANPVALISQNDNTSEVRRALGTLQVDYAIPFVEGLRANLSTGFDILKGKGHNNISRNAAWSSGGPGQLNDYTGETKSKLFDFYLNYKKDFDQHSFDATAGYSYQDFDRTGSSLTRSANGNKFRFPYEVNAAGDTVAYVDTPRPNTLISVFGRLNYNFKERYLITATVRNDQSSRFSPQHRSGWFPSVAVGWRMTEETFLQSSEAVSNLKLRASWGITGQQNIGTTYPYLALITKSTETAKYQFGENFYTTYRPNGFDEAIKWEESTTFNAGLDFGFMDDRLTGTFDVYKRETKDLLNNIPVAAGSNLSNYVDTNVGTMENRGVEVTLSYNVVQKQNARWNVGVNFTRNINEITRLTRVTSAGYQGLLVGGIQGGVGNTVQNHQVGYPTFSFFVFEQVYGADGKPIEGLYVDQTGNGGSVVSSDANRLRLKSPNAQYLAGINSTLTVKDFDFSFSGRLSVGNFVYNNVHSSRANYSSIYNSNGFLNNLPSSITETGFNNPQYLSSHYIQDGSFFKMDYMSAGYSFNDLMGNKLKARVGFTVNNPFFVTDYDGIDPEVAGGIDNVIYPRPRTFMLNLSITY